MGVERRQACDLSGLPLLEPLLLFLFYSSPSHYSKRKFKECRLRGRWEGRTEVEFAYFVKPRHCCLRDFLSHHPGDLQGWWLYTLPPFLGRFRLPTPFAFLVNQILSFSISLNFRRGWGRPDGNEYKHFTIWLPAAAVNAWDIVRSARDTRSSKCPLFWSITRSHVSCQKNS